MKLSLPRETVLVAVPIILILGAATSLISADAPTVQNLDPSHASSAIERISSSIIENLAHLILTAIAIFLAYLALRGDRKLREKQQDFDEKKFRAEEEERKKLATFRQEEYRRFAEPAADIAKHIADFMTEDPHWAYRALEGAKLLPYTDTLFGERSKHFREEKAELAGRFTPYLLKRCETLITKHDRDVWLFVDAGTTLYHVFDIIGKETARLWQQREKWIDRFHLATNNLPGIEKLIQTGRKIPNARYSGLAIDDCRLLPGIPVPIFSAVAGSLTEDAIHSIKAQYKDNPEKAVILSLVVGNWVRIRNTLPRCPVPMARGKQHLRVKQSFVEVSDEIYVISPLGKVFVDYSNQEVNSALGYKPNFTDLEDAPYEEVDIDNDKAKIVKLVTTLREKTAILHRHSNCVEDALVPTTGPGSIALDDFSSCPIQDLPHLLFPFDKLPESRQEQIRHEFPHYHTRINKEVLKMFHVDPSGY